MENKVFINFTNHPSGNWDEKQIKEASVYGEIVDVPFPKVPPTVSKEEILALAESYVSKITQYAPAAVLCQGEFCLAYQVIRLLMEQNIKVLAACSDRETIEWKREDGSMQKEVVFRFVQFREY